MRDSTDEYYCLAGKCHVFIIDRRKVEMERKAFLSDKSHYAVIFTSLQSEVNKDYAEMDELTNSLSKKQYGLLGIESSRLMVSE